MEDRKNTNDVMRLVYNELIIETIADHIVNLENLRETTHMEESDRPVPLDVEFKSYLDESKYTRKTRDKMLSNLRKLNTIVIDNGRGDSK